METFILSDGGTLSYEKKGEGNALLFIHGLGAESSMYKPQIEYFSKKYQVIVPDLRGNGQSDELACSPAEVLDLQANDIVELLEHLDVKTVVVCGVSYGGVMAIHLITRFPKLFKGMILCDTFCTTETTPLLNLIVKITLPLSNSKWFMKRATRLIYKRWPLASAYFNKLFSNFRKDESILQRKAIMNIDYRESLKYLNIPVLCMAGDYGKKLVDTMNTILKYIPSAKHFVIYNSFDPSNLCQSDIYDGHIEKFLAEDIGWLQ